MPKGVTVSDDDRVVVSFPRWADDVSGHGRRDRAEVVSTISGNEKAILAKSAGAHHVIDHRASDVKYELKRVASRSRRHRRGQRQGEPRDRPGRDRTARWDFDLHPWRWMYERAVFRGHDRERPDLFHPHLQHPRRSEGSRGPSRDRRRCRARVRGRHQPWAPADSFPVQPDGQGTRSGRSARSSSTSPRPDHTRDGLRARPRGAGGLTPSPRGGAPQGTRAQGTSNARPRTSPQTGDGLAMSHRKAPP
jgi:hypothetical protein